MKTENIHARAIEARMIQADENVPRVVVDARGLRAGDITTRAILNERKFDVEK
jgi:hypothetical protein